MIWKRIYGLTGIYISNDVALKTIMYNGKPTANEFKTKLGFRQHDIIMRKEQSVLTKIIKLFAKEEILLQHSVLGYLIDLYFPKHRLAIDIDENGHKDRNIDYEIKRQKAIENELIVNFLELILTENIMMSMLNFIK